MAIDRNTAFNPQTMYIDAMGMIRLKDPDASRAMLAANDTPFDLSNYRMSTFPVTGIMGTDQANMFTEDYDDEYVPMPEEEEDKQSGLQTLLSYLPFGSNSIGGRILGGIRNFFDFKNSPMYRPATTSAFGYTPAQLNQMNALGGFYSEPMREVRRRSNRISNMLQRAAAGKNYSRKNLQNLMNQFDMGGVDTGGMIQSIKESSDMGYGRGGGRDFDSGRDYSSSPGAIAGDMEYGEE